MTSKILRLPLAGTFLFIGLLGLGLAVAGNTQASREAPRSFAGLTILPEDAQPKFPIALIESEWRQKLTAQQCFILRDKGTEMAFTGLYDKFYQAGTYYSAATGQPLFRSEDKFDSGSGWPSFFQPIGPDAVVLKWDNGYGMRRVEVLDSSSGSHLGHVFDDGPNPTGLRYCINSAALIFVPKGGEPPQLVKDYLARFGSR